LFFGAAGEFLNHWRTAEADNDNRIPRESQLLPQEATADLTTAAAANGRTIRASALR